MATGWLTQAMIILHWNPWRFGVRSALLAIRLVSARNPIFMWWPMMRATRFALNCIVWVVLASAMWKPSVTTMDVGIRPGGCTYHAFQLLESLLTCRPFTIEVFLFLGPSTLIAIVCSWIWSRVGQCKFMVSLVLHLCWLLYCLVGHKCMSYLILHKFTTILWI